MDDLVPIHWQHNMLCSCLHHCNMLLHCISTNNWWCNLQLYDIIIVDADDVMMESQAGTKHSFCRFIHCMNKNKSHVASFIFAQVVLIKIATIHCVYLYYYLPTTPLCSYPLEMIEIFKLIDNHTRFSVFWSNIYQLSNS